MAADAVGVVLMLAVAEQSLEWVAAADPGDRGRPGVTYLHP